MKRVLLTSLIAVALVFGSQHIAHAEALISPQLRLPPRPQAPRVALTFDACSGRVDARILDALVAQRIKSTVFVTARWLKRNPEAIALMRQHPELFEIENHGARHLAAVDRPMRVFGVRTVGTAAGLMAEVNGGADAIQRAFGHRPTWFRGATALYSKSSETDIAMLGFRIAGYNRLGDGGAEYTQARTLKSFSAAVDGDVIIAHINQPLRPAGAGVVDGIAALKARGFEFVTLDEAFATSPLAEGHAGH